MILCIGATPAAQRVMLFSRLVPDSVNRANTTLDGAAGKSVNVAKVLNTLGETVVATGFFGGDRGENLRRILLARGIELEVVPVPAVTRQCITVIDQSAGTITELVEESRPVEPSHYEQLLGIVQRRVAEARAVVMSGSLTPGGPVDFYRRCTELASAAGAISVLDAQGPPLVQALSAGPGLVKPNRAELAATIGHDLADHTAVAAAARELCDRGAQRVVVTAGKAPALAFDGAKSWRIHSPLVTVVNPIGSGDAFTAALAWRLVQGDDLGQACRWAAAAGAANTLSAMPGELEAATVERLQREVTLQRI